LACRVWLPTAGVVMLTLVVEGDPGTRMPVPTAMPSRVKVMVPDAAVEPATAGETEAETCRKLPAVGVRVAGVTATVGALLETLMETGVEVDTA